MPTRPASRTPGPASLAGRGRFRRSNYLSVGLPDYGVTQANQLDVPGGDFREAAASRIPEDRRAAQPAQDCSRAERVTTGGIPSLVGPTLCLEPFTQCCAKRSNISEAFLLRQLQVDP